MPLHEQIRLLKRFAVMTGVIAIAVLLIAASRPNQTMDRTESVFRAITCGLAISGPFGLSPGSSRSQGAGSNLVRTSGTACVWRMLSR
jgi:hypothetical protein